MTTSTAWTVIPGSDVRGEPSPLLDRSHGETFLEVLRQRFAEPGFYLIDEP